jgi:hypothetical protein
MSVKSSITGRFVKAADALLNPDTTYTVKPPRPSSGKTKCPTCHGRGYLFPDEDVPVSYPYEDGDVTILGPGIFAGTGELGETVINWNGTNYVPQEKATTMPYPA